MMVAIKQQTRTIKVGSKRGNLEMVSKYNWDTIMEVFKIVGRERAISIYVPLIVFVLNIGWRVGSGWG